VHEVHSADRSNYVLARCSCGYLMSREAHYIMRRGFEEQFSFALFDSLQLNKAATLLLVS
jgi:hypothetical protein